MRLDVEMVNRGLVGTRNKAKELVVSGKVCCDGKCIQKPAFDVDNTTKIEIKGVLKYVSRGGLKLEKALNVFGINMGGRVMLDIGSSTGGFTDCALKHGVKKVFAVDVGSGQLDNSLRLDNRVIVYENTDIRKADLSAFKDVDIISIDVSFISVTKIVYVLEKLPNVKEIICLIKPQFECGMEVAKKFKGIIKDSVYHIKAINDVVNAFESIGFSLQGIIHSPIKGGDGNIEYLAYFGSEEKKTDISNVVKEAFDILI